MPPLQEGGSHQAPLLYTDRVRGDTYHPYPLTSPAKGRGAREQKHATSMNGTQSKLPVLTKLSHVSSAQPRKDCADKDGL